MFLSANRCPPRIKSGAGFRRNMRYRPEPEVRTFRTAGRLRISEIGTLAPMPAITAGDWAENSRSSEHLSALYHALEASRQLD
jgi:hypothetical protein